MSEKCFDDLRSFIEASRAIGECTEIHDADWNKEINALTEMTAELIPEPPLLLFERIRGYPAGFRVVSLPIASRRRAALALGLPVDKTKLELLRLAASKVSNARPIPPVEVKKAPVMEYVLTGAEVDVLKFPSLLSHDGDGGRYIGTGDSVINRDPDSDFINMGTYRIQVHEKDLLGLWMSPGQQGRLICEKYWKRGKSAPVVATFGGDPLTFWVSCTKFPWGHSELDYVGGIRGRPLEIVRGPLTGLPIPAHAEIAIEGEVPPPTEQSRDEGPFGEWPGYYSGGSIGTGKPQPVIRIKAIYHRKDPILVNMAPLWPGALTQGIRLDAGMLWNQLEAAGISDVMGVYIFHSYLVVVSIRQCYAGHARQAGMAAVSCSAAARNGRYVVIVDEDIDPCNIQEVLWAMETRVNPATDIEIVDGCWSTPLDPRMPPDKRDGGDYTNSRAIYYAVRPFAWKDRFPKVSRSEPEWRLQVVEKYRGVLPFPRT